MRQLCWVVGLVTALFGFSLMRPLSAGAQTDSVKPNVPRVSDLGIDLAIVSVDIANLREGPGTDTPTVLKLKRNNILALIDRQKTGSWFNVIHRDG